MVMMFLNHCKNSNSTKSKIEKQNSNKNEQYTK